MPTAYADILHWIQEQVRTGFLGELAAQPSDDLHGRLLALGQRLQRHEHLAGVALLSSGEPDHVIDRRIGTHDVDEARELLLHGLEGNALVGLDESD